MYICVNDGKVIFATHLMKLLTMPSSTSPEKRLEAFPFSHEKNDTLILFSEHELNNAVCKAKELDLDYTITNISTDINYHNNVKKAKDVHYHSRTEAIEHLQNNKLPVSLLEKAKNEELLNLRKELNELKAIIKTLK